MIDYATAYIAAIAAGTPRQDIVIAKAIGMDPTTISKWRQQQGFADWLTDQCTSAHRGGLARLLNRALELGIKGSVQHAEFYAKYSGESPLGALRPTGTGLGDERGPAGGLTVLNILVPRPEALPESAPEHRPRLPPPGSAPVTYTVSVPSGGPRP